jgi:DNA segregation ATPase FtsK/SpoIIIE-like protein
MGRFFFKLNIENKQLFEQKNFKSKLENEKLTFIFVIFDILENNLGKIKK